MNVFILIIGICISLSKETSIIYVPSAGNCDEDTVLKCQVFDDIGYTVWFGLNRYLVRNGTANRPEDSDKYTETIGTLSFTLTIHNTSISDEGDYRCRNEFDESQPKHLNVECKASSATQSVTSGKKVQITVDKLYPASPRLSATFKRQTSAIQISGSTTCSSSTQYTGYYRCVWTSSNSLDDGSYIYSIVVTTITQAAPLAGSFKIASPTTPVISNVVQLNATREVVYGNEGQSLTIQCTSTGGYPSPTVTWYKNNISSSNQLSTTSSGTLQSDGTYTVNLQHTSTPTTSDDRKYLICRSYYPQADSAQVGSNNKSVLLYLSLKPSQPTVTQTSVVSAGSIVTVSCTTSGCRPAASISWLYQGGTYSGSTTNTPDAATETFTVVSTYTRQVTAADNGQSIQCIVTHPALVSPAQLTRSTTFNVQFLVGPSTTLITGNREIVAIGSTPLTLTCITGSSNPASDITWRNGSHILESNRPYTTSTGVNNGVVRSQQLILYPTRYMDGDDITCSVSNSVSQSPVVDKIKLNLKYSPIVTIQGQQQQYTFNEGENKQFTCTVDSKPRSKITWYHGNSLISQETPTSGVSSLSFSPVNRTHYGGYSCKANNGIGSEQQDQISITMKFKPLTTTITGNNNIIANGKSTLTLDCTSGSSNPISDITWKINNVFTPATQNLSDQSGEYGGIKRRQRLILTPTRANDGDIISCEAKNSLGTPNRNEETLDLRYRPLITPMSGVIVVEGNNTELICAASSKPASIFKWYKQGQEDKVLHQGTGTLENNKLSYPLTNVRRGDAATYTCNANNGIENPDNKNNLLTVYYPPDVSVTTTNTTINAAKVIVTCNAHGVPDTSYAYGKWVQTWPGYNTPISEHSGSQRLELSGLAYEHSGIYTCSVSNGIKVFGTNQEYMEGSVQLVVKSFPIITYFGEKTSARLMENAGIDVYYFSNAAGANVKIYRNGSRQEDVKYSVTETNAQVDLKVFKYTIKTEGVRARILVHIKTKYDIGHYDVVVTNEIDSAKRSFEIIAKGPPGVSYNVTVDNIQQTTARVSWQQGYHGGFPQTFLIQLSTDRVQWENVETVYGGTDESEDFKQKVLTDLSHSTTYFVRIYAFNREGNGPFSQYQNFTTRSLINSDTQSSSVGGIVGGVVSALIVIALIVVLVVLLRRKVITKDGIRTRLQAIFRKPPHEGQQTQPTEMDNVAVNDLYEQTKPNDMNKSNINVNKINLYEKLERTTSTANTNAYDTIKVEKDTTADGKVEYENLPKKTCTTDAFKSEIAEKLATGKTRIYENLKPGVKIAKKK